MALLDAEALKFTLVAIRRSRPNTGPKFGLWYTACTLWLTLMGIFTGPIPVKSFKLYEKDSDEDL